MVLTSALFLMSFAIHDAHAASRSAWRQHGGDEVPSFSGWGYNVVLLQNWANYPNLVNNGATGHGPLYLFEQYSAGIPAETDPGWTTTAEPELPRVDQALLARLGAALDARLDDADLTMDQLAKAVGMSRRTLQRELGRIAGVDPSTRVRERRPDAARTLLRRGGYTPWPRRRPRWG